MVDATRQLRLWLKAGGGCVGLLHGDHEDHWLCFSTSQPSFTVVAQYILRDKMGKQWYPLGADFEGFNSLPLLGLR